MEQPVVREAQGGVELVDEIAAEWRALCLEGPCNEPFYQPEWIAAHLRAFPPDGALLLLTARRAGRLRAVLPLVQERVGFRGLAATRLRGAVNPDHSGRFDLVHGLGDGEVATRAIWRFLAERPGWDALEVADVPEGGALHHLLALAAGDGYPTRTWESMRTPYVSLPGPGEPIDKIFADTTAKFRANLRRRMRSLEAKGPVKLVRIEEANPAALECFYHLEGAGWKGKAGTAIACDVATRRFYDEVARSAARWGYLTLYVLECGRHPVAMHFGLAQGGRYFVPKLTYDEAFHEYGPGHLIVQEILRDCVARGLTEFDFVGPWMDWKAAWTSASRRHFRSAVYGKGPSGRALHLARTLILPAAERIARKLQSERVRA